MQRTAPPFRADHVGSLLRPAALKEARARHQRGEIAAAALRAIEDREIEKAVRKQEEIGLKLATDGELRRSWYQFDFLKGLDGVELYQVDEGIAFHGVKTKAESVRTVARVDFSSHPHVDDFRFLKEHTRVAPKMTIPAPNMLHFRPGRRSISKEVYPDLEPFFEDVANASREALRAFYDAGCRYLQFDDTTWAMMCDERELAHSRERGDEPEKLPATYARMINRALEAKPADMTVTMHSCRGNFRSTWIAQGGYEPFAERLFNEINIDGYFLEYDNERSGGFEPLRFFPKGNKQLVLGLITSKSGALEKKDDIKRAASTRRPNTSRSISFVCRRNAGSLRRKKATSSPRTNSGRSSAWWWRSPMKCGVRGCRIPNRRSVPITSAACCGRRRLGRRGRNERAAKFPPRRSARSRIARLNM
jgi:5-methyltetrahydropteroyltriglutamate--homocysteine methyltransferase